MLSEQGIVDVGRGPKSSPRSQLPPNMNARAFPSGSSSNIHMTVESRLAELIGQPPGASTARSRNDQVATDFKLWVRSACGRAGDAIRALQRILVSGPTKRPKL